MTEYKHSLGMLALLVSSPPDKRTVFGRALDQLVHDVEGRGVSVLASESLTDAASILRSDPAIQCVLIRWEMDTSEGHADCTKLLVKLHPLIRFISAARSSKKSHHFSKYHSQILAFLLSSPEFLHQRPVQVP